MTSTTLPGANPTEHGGAATASDFGDTRAEFQSLLSGCGLYDLNWRAKIAVTGGDRVRWLNGMVTNNVRDLAPGHGVYAFMLNAQGRIQDRNTVIEGVTGVQRVLFRSGDRRRPRPLAERYGHQQRARSCPRPRRLCLYAERAGPHSGGPLRLSARRLVAGGYGAHTAGQNTAAVRSLHHRR